MKIVRCRTLHFSVSGIAAAQPLPRAVPRPDHMPMPGHCLGHASSSVDSGRLRQLQRHLAADLSAASTPQAAAAAVVSTAAAASTRPGAVNAVLLVVAMEQEAAPIISKFAMRKLEHRFLPGAPFVAWEGHVGELSLRLVRRADRDALLRCHFLTQTLSFTKTGSGEADTKVERKTFPQVWCGRDERFGGNNVATTAAVRDLLSSFRLFRSALNFWNLLLSAGCCDVRSSRIPRRSHAAAGDERRDSRGARKNALSSFAMPFLSWKAILCQDRLRTRARKS